MQSLHDRDAILYKMHGDCQNSAEAILAKEDYERYHPTRGDFLTALLLVIFSKTFMFIGFSFSDPNMDYVLARMFNASRTQSEQALFASCARSQWHPVIPEDLVPPSQARLLSRIRSVTTSAPMVDSYDQITEVLRRVETRHKSKTIFVSGAAHEYGMRWTSNEALDFVHKLWELAARDYFRLVTGLGVGIGSTAN